MSVLSEVKGKLFPKGLRREAEDLRRQVLSRVTGKALRRDLARLGVAPGDLLCVHSKLSALGHVVGGPETVLAALRDLLGPEGTLMMPTFCGGNSTFAYVQAGPPPFDPQRTPCTTGALCESFRVQAGTVRSLHPTHSVAAQGPLAEELTRGHEESLTPFGPETPYARLVALGGKTLLFGVNANSVLHHVQELVNWPNLFVDQMYDLSVMTPDGTKAVSTFVHRSGPYHHVMLPGREAGEMCLLHLPSYGLPHCLSPEEERIYGRLRADVALALEQRREHFVRETIVRFGPVGQGPGAVLDAPGFCRRVRTDLEEHFAQHRSGYLPEVLTRIMAESRGA